MLHTARRLSAYWNRHHSASIDRLSSSFLEAVGRRRSAFTGFRLLLITTGCVFLVGGLGFAMETPPPRAHARGIMPAISVPSFAAMEVPGAVLPEPESTQVSALDEATFLRTMKDAVEDLGSVSIGRANRGYLFNGVAMPSSPQWIITEPERAFGTEETVQAIAHAIAEVNRLYPGTPPLYVGHLSRKQGGWLRPHRSHQSGRDVDLGFYYLEGPKWYARATDENFDVVRNWALLSAMMKTTLVEYVFLDRSLHEPLRIQAEQVGENAELIQAAFDGTRGKTQPLIRHARGHDDHMHVRFASPVAVQTAARARAVLGRRAYQSAALLNLLRARAHKQRKNR